VHSRILSIIIKSLTGEATGKEADLLEKWKEDPANAEEDRIIRQLWKSRFPYPKVVNSDEEFNKLWERKDSIKLEGKQKLLGTGWGIVLKIAAVILFFLSVAWGLNFDKKDTLITHTNSMITKLNPRGQKSRIYLKDGTWVWLNSSSKIQYQEVFTGHEQRELSLDGEAYFEVARDSLKPFKVHAGVVDIEVLGTTFNVKSDESAVSIALKEGSVKVTWEDDYNIVHEQFLQQGDFISIDNTNYKFEFHQYDPREVMGWKDGILVFNEATFEEVKNSLQSWYDIDIHVQGSAKPDWYYSGVFDNYVLENVLHAIGFAENFDYEIDGDSVNIVFN
jgi:ferric-dicitrate binding protein FerR (iron transport regulator)